MAYTTKLTSTAEPATTGHSAETILQGADQRSSAGGSVLTMIGLVAFAFAALLILSQHPSPSTGQQQQQGKLGYAVPR